MADRAAPIAIDPSGVQRRRSRRRGQSPQSSALAVPDRLAPKRCARRPGARQRPLPDAEIDDGKVSWVPPGDTKATPIFMPLKGAAMLGYVPFVGRPAHKL